MPVDEEQGCIVNKQFFCNDHSRVEDDALISELLQRGRVHLNIVPGNVVEAEVVGKQHQEVWLPRRLVEEKKKKEQQHHDPCFCF